MEHVHVHGLGCGNLEATHDAIPEISNTGIGNSSRDLISPRCQNGGQL